MALKALLCRDVEDTLSTVDTGVTSFSWSVRSLKWQINYHDEKPLISSSISFSS